MYVLIIYFHVRLLIIKLLDYAVKFKSVLADIEEYVKVDMQSNDPSHDYNHIQRVVKMALHLAKKEGLPNQTTFV
jgi:HD superfamily phosphodiesterase